MDEQLPIVSDVFIDTLWDQKQHFGAAIARKPQKSFNREQIAKDFVEVFHLVGGVPRLAHWANEHYDRFATKLLPKLLPTHSAVNIAGSVNINYQPAIPPSPLDAFDPSSPIDCEVTDVSTPDSNASS